MSDLNTELEIKRNPPDYLDGDDVFIFETGQTIVKGELILAGSSEIILVHKASLILE